ncbi:MAG: glycoside hydrolase family 99-like domain-containing protein [Clostridia bacterium]
MPRRDRSPRSGRTAMIMIVHQNCFKQAAERAIKCVIKRDKEHRLIFLNAWNEWGEGAYMKYKIWDIDI